MKASLSILATVLLCCAAPGADAAIAQQAYLKASNTGANDLFGYAVAVTGDTVVVGAPWEDSGSMGINGNQGDNNTFNAGAVYVFVRSGSTWVQQAYLKASNPDPTDQFGVAVAISGDTIVVGASHEASNATGVNGNQSDNSAYESGAAYIFVRSGTNWTQQAYLKASNTGGEILGVSPGDLFGSVAISGDTVVVGAYRESSNATGVNGNQADNSAPSSGAAYVFVRNGTNWSQQAYLKASDSAAGFYFGNSVAVSGDTLVVGANGIQAGYVFARIGTVWTQQARLAVPMDQPNAGFASMVDISDNTIVIGGTGMHGAYVFVRSGTTWTEQAFLDAGENWTGLGAVSGDRIVVADSFRSGAILVFNRNGTLWSQQAVLGASYLGGNLGLNWVALSGDRVVAGAGFESSQATGVNGDQCDTSANSAGAAYIFDSTPLGVPSPPDIVVESLSGAGFTNNSSSADFGNTPLGTSSERSFRIRNLGETALTGLGITLTGPNADEFTIAAAPNAPLARCGTTLLTMNFTPTSLGMRSAVLHIDSNDPDEAPFNIVLNGSGIQPLPEISVEQPAGSILNDASSAVDFGLQQNGLRTARTFVIRSLGNVELAGVSVSITGSHASDFAVTTAPVTPVAAGSNTALVVTFTPVATGIRTATLQISSNDGDESPFDITLTGRGVPPFQATGQSSYLKASNTGSNENFGFSVAVSGDTMVVGAPFEDGSATGVGGNQQDESANASGAAYVFVRDGSTWVQQAYLKASNTGAADWFGYRVAISGDTVVVGAPLEAGNATGVNGNQSDNSTANAGAAYVFVRNGSTWVQQAYLKASNTGANDAFGWWVAISGDTVVIGAQGESSNATGVNGNQSDNSATSSGAVYVFVRSGTNWNQQAYLKASNTGAGDFFGECVAIDGDTLVVGAGSEDSSATGVNGNQGDNSAVNSGAAYVFVRSGASWTQQAYLKASNTGGGVPPIASGDIFGVVVAVSSNTIVVGAPGEDSSATGVNGNQADESLTQGGAAYVFVRSGTNWSQQAYLKASHPGEQDQFGIAVSVCGDVVLVGAPYEASSATGLNGSPDDDSAPFAGGAYGFAREGTDWIQRAYFKASNTESNDIFARAVAISGDTLVIGAPGEASNATGVNGNQGDNSTAYAGAVYVFGLVPPPTIVTQPANQVVFTGSNAVFSVVATSSHPPLAYRWLFNGAEIPAAINASLSLSNVQPSNIGTYQVVVSDAAGAANSLSVRLDLLDGLFITSQPVSLDVTNGSTASFSVAAYSATSPHYQWRLNGVDVPNETNSSLILSNVQAPQLGSYTVVITNNYRAVTSVVAALRFLVPPIITQPLVPIVTVAGEDVTLTVTVTNTATLPLYYSWRKGPVITNIMLQSRTCSFTLYNVQTNVTTTNGPGLYRVVITNAASGVSIAYNSSMNLTVVTASPPAVLTGPASNITATAVTLMGSVNPLGSTTTYHFDYGFTTSYGATTPAASAGKGTNVLGVSRDLMGLLPGTNYHYRIVASSKGGLSFGSDQSFTTIALGPRLVLDPDGSGGFILRFTGTPGLSYRAQRAPGVTGPWDTINTQAAPASGLVEFHDVTPPPSQAFYRVLQP